MARKGEEKTIKVTADVEDLKRAFDQVERSYAEVAQASKEYAAALEASSKAVTEDEKKLAKEVEKTTKTILNDSKRRAAAYKDQASAMKTQADALKQKVSATDNDTEASKKNTAALGTAKVAMLAAGAAILGMIAKYGDLARKVAESDKVNASTRESAKRLSETLDSVSINAASATIEVTNLVAAVLGLDDATKANENFARSMGEITLGFRTLARMAKDSVGVEEAIRRMRIDDEMAKKQEINHQKWQRRQREIMEEYERGVKEREILEDLMAKNQQERLKAIEKGEADRETKRKKYASDAARESARQREEDARLAKEDAAALAASEELAGIENLANARAEAEKMRVESVTRQKQDMEERHILQQSALGQTDAEKEQLQIQLDLEKELFDIRTSGMGAEAQTRAERLALLKSEVKFLDSIGKKTDETSEKEKAALKSSLEAAGASAAWAAEQAGIKNAGVALEAGKKAGFYTAESYASFAAGNIVSGTGFALAAAQHAAVAGGALFGGLGGGGGGGGSKSPSSAPEDRLQRSAPIVTQSGPRESTTTVNVNTLSYVSPEDARRIGHAEAREVRATIGGRPK
jgi:hypothetical protein